MARQVPTSMRLDPEIKAGLERAAEAEGRSVSNMTDRILREWLMNRKLLSAERTDPA